MNLKDGVDFAKLFTLWAFATLGSSFPIYGVACLQTSVTSFDVVNVPLVHSNVQTVKTAWSEAKKKFQRGAMPLSFTTKARKR